MSRVAVATINLAAVKHNLFVANRAAQLQSQTKPKVLAVIKANAYGHGLIPMAKALAAADAFAVAHFEEAITLREQFPEKEIVLLQGFADEVELSLLLSQKIQPVIHSVFQIILLEEFAKKNAQPLLSESISVWLKLDTGMHRLGVSPDNFKACWERLNTIAGLKDHIKVMSHFANADIPLHPDNLSQEKIFNEVTSSISCDKSFANSAALLSNERSHYQWVRPGIMLYGVSPFENHTAVDYDLQPVMTLSSRVIAVNKVKKGQTIGYGSSWEAKADTSIAVVGIGYGDGYPRHIAENTPVLIHGKRYSIVGRVSMDMIFVELVTENKKKSFVDECRVGDNVILWGNGLPIEEIAQKSSTIAYELLCQVTARVKFIYLDDTSA